MSLFAAIDAHGDTKYIGEVARGAACGCFCGECLSPLVAKQGSDHVWHFAHEACQERPQCLPGSINLLRRMATQRLLESDSLALPECRKVVTADWRYAGIHEVAQWALPVGRIGQRDMQAAFSKPVAQLNPIDMPDCSIGLWVQIGELDPPTDGEFDGALVYLCPAPPKDAITTQASAMAFLHQNSRWHWLKLPDVFGALANARKRLQDRVADQQTEQITKLQRLRSRLQQQSASVGGMTVFESSSAHREGFAGLPVQPTEQPPKWVKLKKQNTSYFAFEMRTEGEFWILMESADHVGYYVVPGTGWWDGWDESLPRSVGQADLEKGAYRGDGTMDRAMELMRNLGVAASRIDSDASLICAFTGWKS